MERRKFLLVGLGGAVTIAALGALGAEQFSKYEIAAAVRRRLSFLQIDKAGTEQFAKDTIDALLAKRPTWSRIKIRVRTWMSKAGPSWGFSNDRRTKRQHLEDHYATLFLLSSDFFTNGADPTKVVQYVALYDPMRGCSNPFSRPVILDGAATST